MKRAVFLLLVLAALFPLSLTTAHPVQPEPTLEPKGSLTNNLQSQVEAAIYRALDSGRQTAGIPAPYTTEVEKVLVSREGNSASAWLVLTDPHSGEALPTEPGLALARLKNGVWKVALPSEPDWEAWLETTPSDLLPPAIREEWLQANKDDLATAQTAAIGGFLLPWEAGKTVWLSRSVTHVKDYSTAYYAWDFYISGQMYNLYASRGGTVWLAYDSVPNNNHDDVNYLVIKDETTTPVTYHLYLHLAQNSIPRALKTIGAPVVQGQFIGIADNTGASTGHHLHFHVFTSPTWKYWGPSVDITFVDVPINGGRPRRTDELDDCKSEDICLNGASSYVSGNKVRIGPTPPEGDILEPVNGVTIATPNIHLEGWASDADSGLFSAQFMAEWDGTWHAIGSPFSTPQFEMDWDFCTDQVPDGPISLALKLRDNAGSQSVGLPGLRHFIKNFSCSPPPPTCVPDATQVAIFADPDYHGLCTLLDAGSYLNAAALGSLGGDNAASIQVGASMQATLYTKDSKTGRSETISRDDSNLADNRIGNDTVSSVLVQTRLAASLLSGAEIPENNQPDDLVLSSPAASAAPLPVPYFDDLESGTTGWSASGFWRSATDNNHTPEKTTSWRYSQTDGDYDNGLSNQGSLISPAVAIPASGNWYLRFWYFYETETIGPYWDQRKVQIATDGGAFEDVMQLAYDPQGLWLQSPVIDLKPYLGHSIQIRFYFNTMDEILNRYKGWYVDDLSISDTPPPVCSKPDDVDDNPAGALDIGYNTSTVAEICPGGDVDYFKFTGRAGDQIGAAVTAQATGSNLDSYLFLLDADGASVLASSDDLIPLQLNDSHLSYTLPRTGTYYLKVRAWNHPSVGGQDHGYTLRLFQEQDDPSAQFTSPITRSMLSGNSYNLQVTAADTTSGISHVEFLWHSGDWETGKWTALGEDWDGQDGWSFSVDLANIPPQGGIAFYARAYDWAGNWIGTGAWDLMKAKSFSFFPIIAR